MACRKIDLSRSSGECRYMKSHMAALLPTNELTNRRFLADTKSLFAIIIIEPTEYMADILDERASAVFVLLG